MTTETKAPAQNAFAWRKSKRPLLLKISFGLILVGFVLGYNGGVNGSAFLTTAAFAVWGAAGVLAAIVKS